VSALRRLAATSRARRASTIGRPPRLLWLTGVRTGHRNPKSTAEEANMAGMIRKLIVSGIATKVIQEARKPQNQAKLKKMIADFQNKNGGTKRR
jgi:hypothetical protein